MFILGIIGFIYLFNKEEGAERIGSPCRTAVREQGLPKGLFTKGCREQSDYIALSKCLRYSQLVMTIECKTLISKYNLWGYVLKHDKYGPFKPGSPSEATGADLSDSGSADARSPSRGRERPSDGSTEPQNPAGDDPQTPASPNPVPPSCDGMLNCTIDGLDGILGGLNGNR